MDHLQVLRQNYTPLQQITPITSDNDEVEFTTRSDVIEHSSLYLILKRREKRELCRHQEEFLLALQINKHSVAALNQSISPICHKIKPRKLQKHFEGSRHDADNPLLKGHIRIPHAMLELQQKVSPGK